MVGDSTVRVALKRLLDERKVEDALRLILAETQATRAACESMALEHKTFECPVLRRRKEMGQ